MRVGLAVTVVVCLALALAQPAWAQPTRSEKQETQSTKLIELGGGFSGSAWFPSLEGRVNVSPGFAVDVVTNFDPTTKHGVRGMYLLQVHQTVRHAAHHAGVFVTYGVAGGFEYLSVPESRFTYASGDTIVFPGSRRGEISPPFAFAAGGGYRVRLADHLILEAGVQALIPFGYWQPLPLLNAGLIVPIGR
jgi:hypothetical protein